jgi:hypothetical protein
MPINIPSGLFRLIFPWVQHNVYSYSIPKFHKVPSYCVREDMDKCFNDPSLTEKNYFTNIS